MIEKKVPWSRLLWIKQDYPDNFTDPEFTQFMNDMNDKREGPPTIEYDYGQIREDVIKMYNVFLNSCFVYIVFAYIFYHQWNPITLTGVITLWTMFISTHRNNELSSLLNIKSSVIIIFTLLTLSPVLKSLSKTTSSDSIWTVSFWLNIIYIITCATSALSPSPPTSSGSHFKRSIFYDINDHSNNKPSNLSTNLLLANLAMLASRLENTTQVFCFLLTCIQVNIILPRIINISHVKVSGLSNIIVYVFISYTIGYRITVIFLVSSLAFIQLMPRLFYYWQVNYRRKDFEILDLWDPRKPIID